MGSLAGEQPSIAVSPSLRAATVEDSAWLEKLINRHGGLCFALLSVLYFATAFALSSVKLLWFDELITYHVAKLGTPSAIWTALARGADPNPPLIHLAVAGMMRLFGDHEWVLRLPAMIGYWVGMLSLFLFLRRRLVATWALTGVVLLMAMAAFEYSIEARTYGLLYGFAMLALLCWTYTVNPRNQMRGSIALCMMTLALILGISTNYFAVLALLPIAGGEFILTLERTRAGRPIREALRIPIWTALTLAASSLLIYRELIAASIHQFAPYAWNRVSLEQVMLSYTQMVGGMLYPLLALFVFGAGVLAATRLRFAVPAKLNPEASAIPQHELVAAILFLAYPVLGYILASIKGGMMAPRLVVPVCFGFAICSIAIAHRIFGHLRYSAIMALTLVALCFVGTVFQLRQQYSERREAFFGLVNQLSTLHPDEPLVVADSLMLLTLNYYAPAPVTRRILLPIDFAAIHNDRGEDSAEQNLWSGRGSIFHLKIVSLADLQHATGDYVLLANDENWLIDTLRRRGYSIDRLSIDTHMDYIDNLTPLVRDKPVFFSGYGDQSIRAHTSSQIAPIQFDQSTDPKLTGVR